MRCACLLIIMKQKYFSTSVVDVYKNQALEKALFEKADKDEVILFLWRNDNTVVIGKNQDVFSEVKVDTLLADGGHIARRISGGGAVYHDLDNLNFTFIASADNYDIPKQLSVITNAINTIGINSKATGRNDIEIDGRKFSGNAFYRSGGVCLHHGTIMTRCSREKIERYLAVDGDKLKSNGVCSVRARVCSLSDFCPGVTVEGVASALKKAFGEVYGGEVEPLDEGRYSAVAEVRTAEFSNEKWIYNSSKSFESEMRKRFSWGGFCLKFNRQNGRIAEAKITTDSLETEIFKRLERSLLGTAATKEDIARTVEGLLAADGEEKGIRDDIAKFVLENGTEEL